MPLIVDPFTGVPFSITYTDETGPIGEAGLTGELSLDESDDGDFGTTYTSIPYGGGPIAPLSERVIREYLNIMDREMSIQEEEDDNSRKKRIKNSPLSKLVKKYKEKEDL